MNSCSSVKTGNLKVVTVFCLACCDFIYTFAEKLRKVTKLEFPSGLLVNGPEFSPCVSSVAQRWGETNPGLFHCDVYTWQNLTVSWDRGRREVLGVYQHNPMEVMVRWHRAAVLAVALVCTWAGRKKWLLSVTVRVRCFGERVSSCAWLPASGSWFGGTVPNLLEEEGCVADSSVPQLSQWHYVDICPLQLW